MVFRPRRLRPVTALALAGALILGACGGDDEAGPDTVITEVDLTPISDAAEPADNPRKPAVALPATIPTELMITDLVDGDGYAAENGDTVIVDYVGVRSEDGVEFDNSYDRGIPFDVVLGDGRVIPGWEQGLMGIRAGGSRQLDIPAEFAYGDTGAGEVIRPGDAITFVVEARAVIPATTPEDAPTDLPLEVSVGRTELSVVEIEAGEGEPLQPGDTAIVHVQLIRGDDLSMVYNTWEFGDPVQLLVQDDGILSGLIQGLEGLKVGGLRILAMPPELAWGPEGNPGIEFPGDVDLIAVVELHGAF